MSQEEIDKLLKILKRKKDEKVKYQDDILNFIEFYNIKSGRQPVRTQIIVDLYNNWSKNPVSQRELRCRLNNYFIPKFYHHNEVFMLSQNSLNLSKPYYEALAEEKAQVSVIRHQKIVEFLKEYNIEKGQYYVSDALLLKMFRLWAKYKNYTINQLTQPKVFHLVLRLYFPCKQNKYSQTLFGINQGLRKELAQLENGKIKKKKANPKI